MGSYYDEVLEEIAAKLQEHAYEDALFLIRKELEMPYIPSDVEEKLRAFYKDAQYGVSQERDIGERSLDQLLHDLTHGREKKQLLASEQLMQRNLRVCIDVIQNYLSKDPFPEAAALLIEAIAEQEIDEDFTYIKEGVEYSFCGDMVTPISESEGLKVAMATLEELLQKNPSLLDLANKVLIHDAMLYLPLSYDVMEAPYIAQDCALKACELMQDEETYNTLSHQFDNKMIS